MERRARIVLLCGAALAAAAAAAAAVWALALRDSAEPASVADALRRFRDGAREGAAPAPPGVYLYATSGSESVSALGGATHRYPARSTVTVTAHPCGMELRWDVLAGRSDTLVVCAGGDGLVLAARDERHRFYGRDDASGWRCEATPWLPDAGPGARLPHRCRRGDAEQAGTVTVLPRRTVDVGGVPVEAVALRVEARDGGASRGRVTELRLLEPQTGLPLRLERTVETVNDSPLGDVRFAERSTLRLLSLEPRR